MVALAGMAHCEKLAGGLEFRAPAGWTVRTVGEGAVLIPPGVVMEAGGKEPSELYLISTVPGVRDLLDPRLPSVLQARYFPQGATVRASGAPQPFQAKDGPGYAYTYDVVSEQVTLRMRIYVAPLGSGGVAALLAIGRPALMMLRETSVATLAASLSRHEFSLDPPAKAPQNKGGGAH
jgi:hypothetical protein